MNIEYVCLVTHFFKHTLRILYNTKKVNFKTSVTYLCKTYLCKKLFLFQNLTGPSSLDPTQRIGNVREVAEETSGWLNNEHIDLMMHLTKMQWHFKIYGSVGEIGVYYGKYATVLATFTATEYGERFFVCDIFGNPMHMKLRTYLGRKDKFEKAMNKVGFSIKHRDESKRIRVFEDSSMYLSKAVYKTMNLPAFRFYSIDGNHFEPYTLHDVEHVTCVLREGGIISIDDFTNDNWKGVRGALAHFMKMYGDNVIVPLIESWKMYLCTASWHDTYMRYIEEQGIDKSLNLCKVTKQVLGLKFTLYQFCVPEREPDDPK